MPSPRGFAAAPAMDSSAGHVLRVAWTWLLTFVQFLGTSAWRAMSSFCGVRCVQHISLNDSGWCCKHRCMQVLAGTPFGMCAAAVLRGFPENCAPCVAHVSACRRNV